MWMMTVENYEDMFDIDGTCGITTPSPRDRFCNAMLNVNIVMTSNTVHTPGKFNFETKIKKKENKRTKKRTKIKLF